MSAPEQKRPRKERKENADKRRRQLLDAARRSILTHGLAKTTLATVAGEAGLSQGVAVFYFQSKGGLLTETLRGLYQGYEAHWQGALEKAGDDPQARLEALIEADFDAAACGPEVLPLWFAFWGELHFQAQYDAVAEAFDARRQEALLTIWRGLLPGSAAGEVERIAEWMETLTDGYWQRLHIAPSTVDRIDAVQATRACIQRLVPGVFGDQGS